MQLAAPPGMDTRPTQAKVRESLFNMLQADIDGARVLDLFGGSGALALESLSRGAEYAAVCDMDRKAADVIRRNIEKLQYTDKECRLIVSEWKASLMKLPSEPFDIVFLDPPYRMDIFPECTELLRNRGLISNGSLIVMEHATGKYSAPSALFSLYKERTYGETEIHIYMYEETHNEDLGISGQL